MLERRSWLCLTLLLLVGSIQPVTIDARMVVGVSTVNVAFLPIYVTQDKGFFQRRGLGRSRCHVQCRSDQSSGDDRR